MAGGAQIAHRLCGEIAVPSLVPTKAAEIGARWCVIVLGFSIPISVALSNTLLAVFIVFWFASGSAVRRLTRLRENPVSLAALLLAAIMVAGMSWSSASVHQLREAMTDTLRLAMLGLFAIVFLDPSTRDRAQFAFLISMMLVLVLSYAIWAGIADGLPGIKGRPEYPVVFKYHITHNVLMAAAALLFALHAMEASSRRARRLFGGLAIMAVFNVFFMIPGRTGQLALTAAMVYLAIARLRWRGVAVAATGLVALAMIAWLTPGSALHRGSAKAWEESSGWQPGRAQTQSSSVGMRLEFYRNAIEMIGEHPVIGVGSGAFRPAYEAKVRGTQMVVVDHPHNAFLHVAVELGLVGLAALIVLFQVQWRSAGTLSGFTERTAARGLVVIFVAAGLVSSTFGDHTEGLLFAWASGLLFATVRRSGEARR